MFHVVAAIAASLVTSGFTSAFLHKFTATAGAATCILVLIVCILQPRSRIYPAFLILPVIMSIMCLVSSEATIAPSSSTMHILFCYVAWLAFGGTSPILSGFFRQLILYTATLLVALVLIQTIRAGTIRTWTVTGFASGANLVAAQLNLVLPMIVYLAMQSTGMRRVLFTAFALITAFSVICVGSRNGIGSLLIMLVMFGLFNHKKIAAVTCMLISVMFLYIDEIMQNSAVMAVLVRFRFAKYQSRNPRSMIWAICKEHIWNSPWFGIGPGNSDVALGVIDIGHAHNNVIQIALECGLVVAGLYCALMVLLLRLPALAVFRSRQSFVLCLSIVGYCLYSVTDNPIHHPQATLLFAACVHEARRVLQESATEHETFSSQQFPLEYPAISKWHTSPG